MRWRKQRPPFQVTRYGLDIRTVPLKDAIDAGVQHSMKFLEWEAAHESGLDLYKWETGIYPKAFKVKVIAWYNMHNLVEAHRQDAAIAKSARG